MVVPVGNGTLVLGPYYGFQDLFTAGLIEKMPRILAVQAENCAPLARAFQEEAEVAQPLENKGTVAEGIAIAAPARSRQILERGDFSGRTLNSLVLLCFRKCSFPRACFGAG